MHKDLKAPGDSGGHRQLVSRNTGKTWGPCCHQHKKQHFTFRSSSPQWAKPSKPQAVQRENKHVHRKRKSCRHLINLVAEGQGHSFQSSTSLLKMPSPRYIYGNMAVNTGKRKPTTFTVTFPKQGKRLSLQQSLLL